MTNAFFSAIHCVHICVHRWYHHLSRLGEVRHHMAITIIYLPDSMHSCSTHCDGGKICPYHIIQEILADNQLFCLVDYLASALPLLANRSLHEKKKKNYIIPKLRVNMIRSSHIMVIWHTLVYIVLEM